MRFPLLVLHTGCGPKEMPLSSSGHVRLRHAGAIYEIIWYGQPYQMPYQIPGVSVCSIKGLSFGNKDYFKELKTVEFSSRVSGLSGDSKISFLLAHQQVRWAQGRRRRSGRSGHGRTTFPAEHITDLKVGPLFVRVSFLQNFLLYPADQRCHCVCLLLQLSIKHCCHCHRNAYRKMRK